VPDVIFKGIAPVCSCAFHRSVCLPLHQGNLCKCNVHLLLDAPPHGMETCKRVLAAIQEPRAQEHLVNVCAWRRRARQGREVSGLSCLAQSEGSGDHSCDPRLAGTESQTERSRGRPLVPTCSTSRVLVTGGCPAGARRRAAWAGDGEGAGGCCDDDAGASRAGTACASCGPGPGTSAAGTSHAGSFTPLPALM